MVKKRRKPGRPGKATRKVLKALKVEAKARKASKAKKQERIRRYLTEVNEHIAQLTGALRILADRLDDVRSWHLDED
jgi:Mg2+ and Co2+ transporter CorA